MSHFEAFRRTLVVGGAAVLGLLAARGTASANENKTKAAVLLQEADKALDAAGCFQANRSQVGCGNVQIFKDAFAKYERAFQLYATPQVASLGCRMMSQASGPDLDWAVKSGAAFKGIAWCDYAAYHPDSKDQYRNAVRGEADGLRARLAQARSDKENDQRRIAAAKALYGVGLKMKHDKSTGMVSVGYGALDGTTLQGYIAEYWAAYAPKALERVSVTGSSWYLHPEKSSAYHGWGRQGALGWVLVEPRVKYHLCKKIADSLASVEDTRDLEQWCAYQAVIEANAPLFAFRGKAATWNADQLDGSGPQPDERVFLPAADGRYPIVVTIAGPTSVNDYARISYQRVLLQQMSPSDKYYRDAAAVFAQSERVAKEREAAFKKADAQLGGTKGNVVFAQAGFTGWELPTVLGKKDTADCDQLHYKAYAPHKRDKWYEVEFKVDGKVCNEERVWSAQDERARTGSIAQPAQPHYSVCDKALSIPGNHTVDVTMYEVVAVKTGRKEITRDWRIQDEQRGKRGKKVGTWAARCTTSGSDTASRFE